MNIYGLIKNNQRLVCIIATGIFVFSFAMFARGAGIQDPNHNPSKYTSLMREVNEFKTGKGDATKKAETVKNLDEFISGEKARLDYIGVSSAKQKKYFKTMESQLKAINEGATGEKSLFSEWFGVGDEQDTVENVDKKIPEAKLPKNPAKFQFSPDPEKVTKLENAKIIPQPKQKLSNELLKLVTIEEAQAVEENVLPVLEDVKSDDKEIKITPEIRELAMKLKNNPVEIVNFVRNSVTYEPYYGAKKGSEGCLAELICNDIDASSLTIALLRAAGIPARYRKSAAIFTVAQLQNLLGVDQTKTAYIALANNGVPVHVLTDLLNNIPFKDADFSQERFLALEWTHVQAFYEYDERGANMENAMNFNSAANTQDVRNALQNLPKKQWIPIDAIVKPYARTTRTILADTAGFNAENFWNSFFQYQGNLSPLGKYKQDIANATGQQIDQNLSEKTSPKKNFDILPITLPYAVASAANQNIQIPVEKFSVLPETYKVKVKISLKRDANDEVVMSRTFAASEVNNARINLSYEGATDVDKAVIEQHGGVHATPSSLVDIIPFFQTNAARYDGVDGSKPVVSIGETLVLKFEYLVKDAQVYTDEKFSVAGNNEGIFTAFSQTQADILLDDLNNENRNSHILLEGNTALAREYAKRVKEDMDVLKKSLDYGANLQFIRAVVTQSRILSEVGGVPTTFDFKGLSLDASAYIADYSNRGAYDNHRKTFRLMWGQQASYLEAQLFKDVAGLSSIATVQGLQFAYAHPETYTVHRITQANAGEIDQLQLSDNTKANMRTDVAAGNTIITPDKPVQDQNWRGILYVSLQPDWMGRYAIGEQATQNGGWTVVEFQINTYQDEENKVHEVNTSLVACAGDCDFLSNPVGKIFDVVIERAADWRAKVIFQEGRQTGSVMCAIDEAAYNTLLNHRDEQGNYTWNLSNGVPCLYEEFSFGTIKGAPTSIEYKSLLATEAVKFYSPNRYNRWEKIADIVQSFKNRLPGKQINTASNLNWYFGTYRYDMTSGGIRSMAMYNPETRAVYAVDSLIYVRYYLSRTKVADRFVPEILGPPAGEKEVASSDDGLLSYKQLFANGSIYHPWYDFPYVVPGKMDETYRNGGSQRLGFPVGNGLIDEHNDFLQSFQFGDMRWNPNLVADIPLITPDLHQLLVDRNFMESEYPDLVEGIMDGFAEIDVFGVTVSFVAGAAIGEAIGGVIKAFLGKVGPAVAAKFGAKFFPVVGWIVGGGTIAIAVAQNADLINACRQGSDVVKEGKKSAYWCGKLGVSFVAFVSGIASDRALGYVVNKYGVFTPLARAAKQKLFSRARTEIQQSAIRSYVREGNAAMRTAVLEDLANLDDAALDQILSNDWVAQRVLVKKPFSQFIKNASNVNRLEHIYRGNETGGWHYYPTGRPGATISNKVMGANGVYKANVEFTVNGQTIRKKSTFFPDNMTEEGVANAINQAYENIISDKQRYFEPQSSNSYRYIVNGIQLELYVDNNTNRFISGFIADTPTNGF